MGVDPLALDASAVRRYKDMAFEAFHAARTHRERGDLNSADEASRFGAAYRETARAGTTRGAARTTWRYGDTPTTRVLP